MFAIVISMFEIKKKKKYCFFKKKFLFVNLSINIVLKVLFLILSNVNISFLKLEIFWKSYTPIKTISIRKNVQFVRKTKFANETLNSKKKIYIILMDSLISFDLYI